MKRVGLYRADHDIASRRAHQRGKGFLPSTVADIVHRAGVSHGTFYNYFPSREDILRAVATEARIMRGWQAEMADSIRGLVDRSFEEAVDHIVKIVIRVLGLREPSH